MHILGLANGTKGGNSEILLKAALLSAKESDPSITTSWIHVPSVSVPPNAGPLDGTPDVTAGTISNNPQTPTNNTIPDHRRQVLNAILDADALIFSTAVYSHQPAATLKALMDKLLGPYTDSALATRILTAQQKGDTASPYAHMEMDMRVLKPRVAGFLVVGGSTTPDQYTMALPTLHLITYSLHVKVVDQALIMGYANPGSVLNAPGNEVMRRADEVGRRVASQIGKSFDEAVYLGPEPAGACPQCHLSKIEIFGGEAGNSIGCVVCGNTGVLDVGQDGVVVPRWDEDSDYCCITMRGKQKHIDDIFVNGSREWKGKEKDPEFEKKLEEWRAMDVGKMEIDNAIAKL